jgi:hypothetical protein
MHVSPADLRRFIGSDPPHAQHAGAVQAEEMVAQAEQLHHGACPCPVCPSPAVRPQACGGGRCAETTGQHAGRGCLSFSSPRFNVSCHGRGQEHLAMRRHSAIEEPDAANVKSPFVSSARMSCANCKSLQTAWSNKRHCHTASSNSRNWMNSAPVDQPAPGGASRNCTPDASTPGRSGAVKIFAAFLCM